MTDTPSKPAVIPDKKPCDREGSTFVPKAMNVSFKSPQYGDITWCVEENDMNNHTMYWHVQGHGMWASDNKTVTARLKNILKAHPDAVVETNYKKWKDIANENKEVAT